MLQLLIGPAMKLLERLIPDPVKQSEAKAEMTAMLIQAQAKEMDSRARVVIAEATGESWLQRNWRPCLMIYFAIPFISKIYLLILVL